VPDKLHPEHYAADQQRQIDQVPRRQQQRLAADEALELGVSHDRTSERESPHEDADEGLGAMRHRLGAFEMHAGIERDRKPDEHRSSADEAVEHRDQLRHRRHLDTHPQRRTDGCSGGHHREEQRVARDPRPEHGGNHRDCHAGHPEQVPAPRRALGRQTTEAEDEQQAGDEIGDGDKSCRHRLSPEHPQHPLRYQKSAGNVDRGQQDRHRTEQHRR
jgi:hypothetical protein